MPSPTRFARELVLARPSLFSVLNPNDSVTFSVAIDG